jgi:hypothetical protein
MMAKRFRNAMARLGVLGELLSFLWRRKRWWLIPIVTVLLLLLILLLFATASGLGPFIYSIF